MQVKPKKGIVQITDVHPAEEKLGQVIRMEEMDGWTDVISAVVWLTQVAITPAASVAERAGSSVRFELCDGEHAQCAKSLALFQCMWFPCELTEPSILCCSCRRFHSAFDGWTWWTRGATMSGGHGPGDPQVTLR